MCARVAKTCARLGVPVRVGVNGGSLAKKIAEKYGAPTAEALAESALESIRLLERFDFDDLVVSVKSSDVRMMIEANRILARECSYPLHLGVTEAGPRRTGLVKGAIGIGALLARRHRRHHPRIAIRRRDRGGRGGEKHPPRARPFRRDQSHLLPDLRPLPDGPDRQGTVAGTKTGRRQNRPRS